MNIKHYMLLIAMLSSALGVVAADSIEVSIITCEPGPAIYELYGHTAIRVRETDPKGRDAVFNYGVFNFAEPGFVWRFVKGETDYQVGAIPYVYFRQEYLSCGRRVWEQPLNLSPEQKAQLAEKLWVNCLPQYRYYRYNFLYDNCTTRCRDMLEQVADIRWPKAEPRSYLQIIHEFAGTPGDTWESLGQDLCLGSAASRPVGVREQMFSPVYFMRFLTTATIPGSRLVRETRLIVNPECPYVETPCEKLPQFKPLEGKGVTPLWAGILWLLLGAVMFAPFKKDSRCKRWCGRVWYVVTLLLLLGVAVVIDMLYFCSLHPTVDTNRLVWVVNPLVILMTVLPFCRLRRKMPFKKVGSTVVAPAALLLSSAPGMAQNAPRTAPRLVIMISVDQLRSDYLEAFMPLFGDHGLRRLMREGRLYTSVQYPFAHPDGVSAPACLYSGASPYDNGVVGRMYLNRETLRPTSSVSDFTPSLLEVSTLTDELKLATGGKAVVFSVAPEAGAAIFSAGHAANGALWIDPETAQWTSSSYYGTPVWLSSFNRTDPVKVGMEWEPASPLVGNVNYYVGGSVSHPFSHKIKTVPDLLTSALLNEKITHCAIQCIMGAAMGRDAVSDLLAVTYYAGGWQHTTIEECGMELQDTYVRLDQSIATLITEAEAQVGPDRVMVVLTSTGYCDQDVPQLSAYRIPTGTFNMSRARSILNMYLGAVYGVANYVEAVYENGIFLDHKLIEQKQINGAELLERSQDLLLQMSGVKDVYTTNRLALGAWTPGVRALRNSHHPKYRGDITINVAAGWHIIDEELQSDQFSCQSYIPFPLVFWGAGVKAECIDTPIEVDCVAPTVAQVLRIRSPNACQAAPLTGLR